MRDPETDTEIIEMIEEEMIGGAGIDTATIIEKVEEAEIGIEITIGMIIIITEEVTVGKDVEGTIQTVQEGVIIEKAKGEEEAIAVIGTDT